MSRLLVSFPRAASSFHASYASSYVVRRNGTRPSSVPSTRRPCRSIHPAITPSPSTCQARTVSYRATRHPPRLSRAALSGSTNSDSALIRTSTCLGASAIGSNTERVRLSPTSGPFGRASTSGMTLGRIVPAGMAMYCVSGTAAFPTATVSVSSVSSVTTPAARSGPISGLKVSTNSCSASVGESRATTRAHAR